VAAQWRVPVLDDPIYAEAAFDFARTGQIVIPDLSGPSAVFEAVWGGLFARVFGLNYGVLRVASLVLALASVPALFWALRLLGASSLLSTLGAAAYLFNPMFFSISNSYMTDGHAVALSVMAIALITRGMIRSDRANLYIAVGGLVAAIGFLSRQQALIVPIAAAMSLIFSKADHRWQKIAVVSTPTLMAIVGLRLWFAARPEPAIRGLINEDVGRRTVSELGWIAGTSLKLWAMYLGVFLLVLLPMLIGTLIRNRKLVTKPLAVANTVGLGILYVDAIRRLDYVLNHDTWWTSTGLGAIDRSLLGERPPLVSTEILFILTLAAFVTTSIGIAVVLGTGRFPTAKRFLLFAIIGVAGSAFTGALAFHLVPLDRYWLPMLPLAILLVVPNLLARIWSVATTTLCVVALGLISIAGTRDSLILGQASVNLANELTPYPIQANELDGGAPWIALTFGVPAIDIETFGLERVPFWVAFFHPELRPQFGIALDPLDEYDVLKVREYSSWLHLEPTYLYLIHRDPSLPFYPQPEDFFSISARPS
jgi:4-amino-4-deoxy-L-arabinose transferase-like glycosyltransferase